MKKLSQFQRKVLGIYILWFFIHLVFLTISERTVPERFWPFQRQDYSFFEEIVRTYDISEFLIYAISPAIIFIICVLFQKKD